MEIISQLSFWQYLLLFIVNFFGFLLIWIFFKIFYFSIKTFKQRIILSLILSSITISLFFIVLFDIGIYLWVKTRDVNALFTMIPLYFCSIPFLLILVTVGSYIQLTYSRIYTDLLKREPQNNISKDKRV